MSRTIRTLLALAGAALILVIAAWFDTIFLRDALRRGVAMFDNSGSSALLVLGSLLVAGSALAMWVLAWRARSVVVSLTYAIVGGFLAALPWLVWNFATQVNDVPPVLPEPLLTVVSEIYFRTGDGSLNAVGTIGAAMLIAGAITLARWWRVRAVPAGRTEATVATPNPTLP